MLPSLDTIRPILERTPPTLRTLLHGLDESWARRPYGPGTWSAHEVVAHLVFGERTDWIPRTRHILAHGDARPFEPFDRAGHVGLAREHTTAALLDLFERERSASLADLDALRLTPADLARAGRHPALGTVTLGHLLATWAVHDLNHVAQACKALAWQRHEDVGPWERYLSILSPPNPR